jgi:cytochrome b6-f complex iron-sulfur subunit
MAEKTTTRRSLLTRIWIGLGGLAIAEWLWLTTDFLRPRAKREEDDTNSVIVAGPVDRFEKGTVTPFQLGKFYLVRLEDGGFLALSRKCTHLGCTLPWIDEQQRFVCPCHSSAFDIAGNVMSPPATRALDLFAVRIENKIVKIDISRAVKRSEFDSSQVVHS